MFEKRESDCVRPAARKTSSLSWRWRLEYTLGVSHLSDLRTEKGCKEVRRPRNSRPRDTLNSFKQVEYFHSDTSIGKATCKAAFKDHFAEIILCFHPEGIKDQQASAVVNSNFE